ISAVERSITMLVEWGRRLAPRKALGAESVSITALTRRKADAPSLAEHRLIGPRGSSRPDQSAAARRKSACPGGGGVHHPGSARGSRRGANSLDAPRSSTVSIAWWLLVRSIAARGRPMRRRPSEARARARGRGLNVSRSAIASSSHGEDEPTIVAPSDRLPPRSRRMKPPRKSESEVIGETPDEIASGSKRRGNLSVRPRSSFRFTSPPATALTFLVALGFLVSPRSGFLGIESGATASLAAQDSAPDAQETR